MSIERAYLKWCKQRFPLPGEQEISDLERRISAHFPKHFRDFLLEWNGGLFTWPNIIIGEDDHSVGSLKYLSGVHVPVDFAELGRAFDLSLFEDNNPPIILPIGRTTANDLIMLNVDLGDEDDGAVFLRTTDQNTIRLGATMDEFFSLLREDADYGAFTLV